MNYISVNFCTGPNCVSSDPSYSAVCQYLLGVAFIASIINAHLLLGTCLLTTYAYKCMRLLTRVYGIVELENGL